MNLTRLAIQHKPLTFLLAFILTVGGVFAFFNLGQLEDPDFTVKQALIVTPYSGASPEEVELEVSDAIETAIQEIKELKYVKSTSWPGLSIITVEIDPRVWGDTLPQVWDELRRKVEKASALLPPGAGPSAVHDDFGDVFGFQLVLVGDGFDYAEMEKYAKDLRKSLFSVPGVARIDLVGQQQKVIYLDVHPTQLSELGVSEQSIEATLNIQNKVVDAGNISLEDKRYRISPSGGFQSPEDVGSLLITPSPVDILQSGVAGKEHDGQLLRVEDIGTIQRGYLDPPHYLVKWNGMNAIGLSITNKPGVNIVDMGKALDEALDTLEADLPHGIEFRKMNWQADAVSHAVDHFLVKFALTVVIVLLVVWVAMGWRVSIIIGTGLIITVFGTFLIMHLLSIELHRLSLGALVIALVMMVDNAIVIADGTIVRLKRGLDKTTAAIEAATKPARKLFGATVIGSVAFAPIFLSKDATGEYCLALFPVIASALLLSWVISVTFTPIQCIAMLPTEKSDGTDPYGGPIYTRFRALINLALRKKWLTFAMITSLFFIAIGGSSQISSLFFSNASMDSFMINYWLPEGSKIENVSADLDEITEHLLADDRVEHVVSYVGGGPPRFYLPVEPEGANPSYGQLIVSVKDFHEIDDFFNELRPWFAENYPDAMVPLRRFTVGPGKNWDFEIRISAPNNATPPELREQADRLLAIVNSASSVGVARHDWRNQVQVIAPQYNQAQGRWTGVTRDDAARALKQAYDGRIVGLYREGADLIPVMLRYEQNDNLSSTGLHSLTVKPSLATEAVPMSQVVDGFPTEWHEPYYQRYNRLRTITIQANPAHGYLLSEVREEIADQIFALELPPGWTMSWGGITEAEIESQAYLRPGIIPAVVITILVLVWLFNAFRPPLIVLMITPLAVIGMVFGMLVTNIPFGFMAMLGGMGLSGMMMKNAIVLLDEIKQNKLAGMDEFTSVQEAAVARLRAVSVTAIKIALGLIPLLLDIFWEGLAAAIIFGVSIGAVFTLFGVPVLYMIFYRISPNSLAKAEA